MACFIDGRDSQFNLSTTNHDSGSHIISNSIPRWEQWKRSSHHGAYKKANNVTHTRADIGADSRTHPEAN